jgi:GMP synthase (glutamine-hydrolysing)
VGEVVAVRPEAEPEARKPEERPVLVLDLGGQYSQLIARRVREARVYSELVSHRISVDEIRAATRRDHPLGRARVGLRDGAPARRPGDLRARHPDARHLLRDAADGARARAAGRPTGVSEFGKTELRTRGEGALFHDLPAEQTVWMSTATRSSRRPTGARIVASRPTPVAAFEDPSAALRRAVPPRGRAHAARQEVLKNFLYEVAGARRHWTPAAVIEEQVERIRAQVGSER